MKNMIKMSLVAAVAVAGLSSTVAAKPLEEAIKNVDVSGMIRLRFDSETDGDKSSETSSDFDTGITFKAKISDKSTAVIAVEADKGHSTSEAAGTDTAKSTRLNAELSLAYLSTKAGSATVSVGRQGIPGPFDDAQGGDGVVAMIPAGPVTLAAGFFTTTSAVAEKDAYELAIMGKAADVSYDLWYANVANTIALTSVHAAAKVGPVMIDARYSMGKVDESVAATDRKATLAKLTVTGKADMIGYTLAVASTGDKNDKNTANAISFEDSDGDMATDLAMHDLYVGALNDATAFVIGVDAAIADVTVGATYLTANHKASTATKDSRASEIDLTASYKLDTNLALSGVYSISNTGTDNEKDNKLTRVEVKYSF